MINANILVVTNLVIIDSEKLYTIWRSCALVFTIFIISWRFARYRRAQIFIIKFYSLSNLTIDDSCREIEIDKVIYN